MLLVVFEQWVLCRGLFVYIFSLSQTLEGHFELTLRPSRGLKSYRALLLELQRYKDTVHCVALGAKVPGHCQEQLTLT